MAEGRSRRTLGTILLGDIDRGTSSKLVRLLNLPAYHIECADSTTNSKVYTVPASFFQKHSIQMDYDQAKAVQYQNNLDPTHVEVKAVEVKSSPR